MLCQKCHKNQATIRYAEVVDGKVADINLCPECMTQHQQDVEAGFNLSGAVPTPKRTLMMADEEAMKQACESCGTPFVWMVQSGQVGCTRCYNLLKSQADLILDMHGAMLHRGKTPRMDDGRSRVREELQTKRSLLRSSLARERYEEAAVLRDEIKDLETALSSSEAGED